MVIDEHTISIPVAITASGEGGILRRELLATRRDLKFELPDGILYTQQATDRDPVELWSTSVGGTPLTKTLLLRR
jgi:hypothetical protein